ncbi:MAG TPA: D-arabinono-1,4-lactone oxidase, partial [Methanomicrobiales archaeon]|nr:D-arabinono-1,4-lactone oxidase [Methanomicrobiales archaeon]
IGWANEVIPKKRALKFDEMEYEMPAEVGPECFLEVRKRIKEKHRKYVGWRVLYRTVAEDDAYLSMSYGRPTVAISLHQNAGLPYWNYFTDIETIFRRYGGRPHWGKKHTLTAHDLEPLYPLWDRFRNVRRRMDPDGVFMSPFLRGLLEEEGM